MAQKNYALVKSVEELTQFVDRLLAHDGAIGLDIETGYHGPPREKYSLHPETAILVGFSFTDSLNWARYVPLAHDTGPNLDEKTCARLLWTLCRTGRTVIHNESFEQGHLSQWFRAHLSDDPEYGPEVRASRGYIVTRSDTMVEAYLLAETQAFGLKFLTEKLFGHTMTELHELFPDLPKNKHKTLRFNTLDPSDLHVMEYACEDALWCLALHERHYERVKEGFPLLYRVESELVSVVCEMERYGTRFDWGFLARAAQRARTFADKVYLEVMADLTKLTGAPVAINLGSSQQVASVLYGDLGIKPTRFTPGSRDKAKAEKTPSADAQALGQLASDYPVVKKIVMWKELQTLVTRYLAKYEEEFNFAADGRVHPNYLQCFVITGRFSCSSPNCQNLPKYYHYELDDGTTFDLSFRDAIIAPDDHYILGFDYSQMELRVMAGEAQEHSLIEAYKRGEDIHKKTASLMFGVPLEEVDDELRGRGKTLNFALGYQMDVKGLAERLAITEEEAQELFDKFFSVLPAIKVWVEKMKQYGKAHGYALTKFGRRMPLWSLKSDKAYVRRGAEREAVNFPCQGAGTGDYPKIAMVRADKALKAAGLSDRVHLFMNVHDALEFYVHRSLSPQTVISVLQKAVVFPVDGWPPIVADWHLGARWGSVRDLQIDLTSDGQVVDVRIKPGKDDPAFRVVSAQGTPSPAPVVSIPSHTPLPSATLTREPLAPSTPPEVGAGASLSGEPVALIVEMTAMPSEHAFTRFMEYLANRSGPNTLTLVTPEGEMEMGEGTSVSMSDAPTLSLLLGGAAVRLAPESVDPSAVAKGISL